MGPSCGSPDEYGLWQLSGGLQEAVSDITNQDIRDLAKRMHFQGDNTWTLRDSRLVRSSSLFRCSAVFSLRDNKISDSFICCRGWWVGVSDALGSVREENQGSISSRQFLVLRVMILQDQTSGRVKCWV